MKTTEVVGLAIAFDDGDKIITVDDARRLFRQLKSIVGEAGDSGPVMVDLNDMSGFIVEEPVSGVTMYETYRTIGKTDAVDVTTQAAADNNGTTR